MSDSDRKRAQRVGELIQHELASVVTNELKDPRVGFVTVTEVRVTGDLRAARVFVSVLGAPESRADSLEALRNAAGYFKRVIAQRLDLRFVPELEFEVDETLDRAERLESIMQAIKKGETETPAETPAAPLDPHTDRSDLADRKKTFDDARQKGRAEGRHEGRPKRRRR